MLLTGTFHRAMDDKQRVTIPKELRAAWGDASKGVFYVAPGTDGSLAIYDESSFVRLADRLLQSWCNVGVDVSEGKQYAKKGCV